jgi:hypothetical protein
VGTVAEALAKEVHVKATNDVYKRRREARGAGRKIILADAVSIGYFAHRTSTVRTKQGAFSLLSSPYGRSVSCCIHCLLISTISRKSSLGKVAEWSVERGFARRVSNHGAIVVP